ncbi:hypothetical protein OIO90_005236 [Microbotryomycetes sp. JL221]|nr:hypothetical protein OIO90_005236 [Microbotryomycetes sp. JL221]
MSDQPFDSNYGASTSKYASASSTAHRRASSLSAIGQSPEVTPKRFSALSSSASSSWISTLLKTGPPALPPKDVLKAVGGRQSTLKKKPSFPSSPKRRAGVQATLAPPKRPLHPTALPDSDFVAWKRRPTLTNAKRISLPVGALSAEHAARARSPPQRLRDGSWDWDGGEGNWIQDAKELDAIATSETRAAPARPAHRRAVSADPSAFNRPRVGPLISPRTELSSIWEDEQEVLEWDPPRQPSMFNERKGSVSSYRKPVPSLDAVDDHASKSALTAVNTNSDTSPAKSSLSRLELPDFPAPPSPTTIPTSIEITTATFEDEEQEEDEHNHMQSYDRRHSRHSIPDFRRLSVPLSIGRAPSEADTHSVYSTYDDAIVSSYFEGPSMPMAPSSPTLKEFGLKDSMSGLAITLPDHHSPRSGSIAQTSTQKVQEERQTNRTVYESCLPLSPVDFSSPFENPASSSSRSAASHALTTTQSLTPPTRSLAAFLGNTTRLVYKPVDSIPIVEVSKASPISVMKTRESKTYSTQSVTAFVDQELQSPDMPPLSSTFTDVSRFSSYTFGRPKDDDNDEVESPNTSFHGSSSGNSCQDIIATVPPVPSPATWPTQRQQSIDDALRRESQTSTDTSNSGALDTSFNNFSFTSSAKRSFETYEPFALSEQSQNEETCQTRPKTWFAGRFVDLDEQELDRANEGATDAKTEHDRAVDQFKAKRFGQGFESEPVSPKSKVSATRRKGLRNVKIDDAVSDNEDDGSCSTISPELDSRLLDAYISREVRRRAKERAQRWAEERWELARERVSEEACLLAWSDVGVAM